MYSYQYNKTWIKVQFRYPNYSGARFTKYLTTILRSSYDNAKVTIDLRQACNYKTTYKERTAFLKYDSLAKL